MKTILGFALLAILGYFGWKQWSDQSVISDRQTPEEKIQALVDSRGMVDSKELASLCVRYPNLTKNILVGQKIKVRGAVKRLWVFGIDSGDYAVELYGIPEKGVVFQTDYKRYLTDDTRRKKHRHKIVKQGNQLHYYGRDAKQRVFKSVLHTEGEQIALEGFVESVGAATVRIHYPKSMNEE